MTKEERILSEGVANLSEINRAYFLAVLRSLSFAQEHCSGQEAAPVPDSDKNSHRRKPA